MSSSSSSSSLGSSFFSAANFKNTIFFIIAKTSMYGTRKIVNITSKLQHKLNHHHRFNIRVSALARFPKMQFFHKTLFCASFFFYCHPLRTPSKFSSLFPSATDKSLHAETQSSSTFRSTLTCSDAPSYPTFLVLRKVGCSKCE